MRWLIYRKGFFKSILIFLFFFLIVSVSAEAISNDLHVNVQVTDSGGQVQTGTFIFVFNITTDEACTNVVYSNSSTRNTDSRGIVSYYLPNVNLNFSDQYWLCYYRNGTLINNSKMGQVPYAFMAKNVTSGGIIFNSNVNFGNYNLTVNGSTLFVDTNSGRVGIGTTAPQNKLNVIGDLNVTTSIFSQNKNLSIGYDYAINGTIGSANWNANYSDYLTTKNYALNETKWGANYSTFLTHITWANAVNGTLMLKSFWDSNYSTNNAAWLSTYNSTYDLYNSTGLIKDWNSTGLIANWSSAGGGISWETAYNGTLAKTDASNSFGAFNQTFDTNTLFIDATNDRVGIGTTAPQNTLNVIGTVNVTENLTFSKGGNLYNNGTDIIIEY